ncbi:MAG: rhamnulokinase [Clostridia bacterium]|nr:rhamnulokinase [Clostridia bacterium]
MAGKRVLAIDLGASSGRGIVGEFDGEKITISEIHRFSNDPLQIGGSYFWDTLRLLHEIKSAILKCSKDGGIDTVGIDTWGVDYGYIDKAGQLLSVPYHYRDERTLPEMKRVYGLIPYEDLYKITGIESMSFNTIFQVSADKSSRPWTIDNAETLLLTPDLLGYFLTGERVCEYTIGSTTAMMDAKRREFSDKVLSALGIKKTLFPKIVMPGNILGKLTKEVDDETGKTGAMVVNVPSHDTSCAVLAVPSSEKDFLFISSGTWSLMGTENEEPIINEVSEKLSFTNEGGVDGKINVMKNIMGLWLIQESRRQWKREGREYSFDELERAANEAEPLKYIINPDDPSFNKAGDLPSRIADFCEKTGQGRPGSVGETVRCIYESLALKYRYTADKLEELCSKKYKTLNIVGGGTKEKTLCKFAADCTGKTVFAGPVEATALGNIAMQLIACGVLKDAAEARAVIKRSFDVEKYEPDASYSAMWNTAYEKFCRIIKM